MTIVPSFHAINKTLCMSMEQHCSLVVHGKIPGSKTEQFESLLLYYNHNPVECYLLIRLTLGVSHHATFLSPLRNIDMRVSTCSSMNKNTVSVHCTHSYSTVNIILSLYSGVGIAYQVRPSHDGHYSGSISDHSYYFELWPRSVYMCSMDRFIYLYR